MLEPPNYVPNSFAQSPKKTKAKKEKDVGLE